MDGGYRTVAKNQTTAGKGKTDDAGREAAPVAFKPVKTRRLFEEICDQIRGELESGALKPGDKLPAERELAARFGVSRLAVREALRSLEYAGIVGLQKGVKGGAFILGGRPEAVRESMQDMLSLGSISLVSLTEARASLLETAIRFACDRATDEDFAALEENIRRTAATNEQTTQAERLDIAREFYHLLAAAAKNDVLEIIINATTEIVMRIFVGLHPDLFPNLVKSRRAFLRHLRARDADKAARHMAQHLKKLHQHLIAHAKKAGLDAP